MARQNPDPYLVLGVSPTATQAEITHAYRTRLRAHHPDTRHTPPSQSVAFTNFSWNQISLSVISLVLGVTLPFAVRRR